MKEYSYAIKRATKLLKTTERIIDRLYELRECNDRLRTQNQQLKDQLELRARWDKENLPDDEQEFIKEFMLKYDVENQTPQQQG